MELKEDNLQLVITEQQLGVLTTNAKDIKRAVEESIKNYDPSNYTIDDIPSAKNDKAYLNKAASALNSKRIELERSFNKPFEEFKQTINETIALIKSASSKIDEIVKQKEQQEKDEKMAAIEMLFKTKNFDVVPLDRIFNPKWLNKTCKAKDIEDEMSTDIMNIKSNISAIEQMDSDSDALKQYYLECLDFSKTVAYGKRLKEERAIRESAKKADATVEVKPEKTVEVKEDDTVYERIIRVKGTRSQLESLASYMKEHGVEFHKA